MPAGLNVASVSPSSSPTAPFNKWSEVIPNATCTVTLLDRLLHHAGVTIIEGDSYRVPESELETAARRRNT